MLANTLMSVGVVCSDLAAFPLNRLAKFDSGAGDCTRRALGTPAASVQSIDLLG